MRERLIGAAVLVIIAVILIPWLVSRAHHPEEVVTRTAWPASASAPAQPYVLPLQAATSGTAAMQQTAHAGIVAAGGQQVPAAGTTPAQPVTGHEAAATHPASGSRNAADNTAASTPAADSGWSVQAASFSDFAAAKTLAKRLRQAGFNVSLSPHEVGKATYYRVRVGPYPTRARARSAAPGVARISNTKVLIRSPGSDAG